MKTEEQYKALSINEFTRAADHYESKNAGVYNLCKKDYPDILEEIKKEPFQHLLDAGCFHHNGQCCRYRVPERAAGGICRQCHERRQHALYDELAEQL